MDRRSALKLGLTTLFASRAVDTFAQDRFPSRPLRLVVPFPAGGPYDVVGRILAQNLGKVLGQNVIVENKAGGETSIGAADVARAEPNGYSLLMGGSTTHIFAPAILAKPPYDALRDFAQLSILGVEPLCIVVRPQFPAKTLADLTALIRANPNKFNYVDSAPSVQLAAEMYKMQAGKLQMVGVPYKGFAPALQDMIAGHVQVMPAIFGSVTSYHQQGVLRILAVFSEKRLASFPDIPTAREVGLQDLVLWTFSLLCTTAGTPKPIVDQLFQATQRAISDDRFVETLRSRGIQPVTNSSPDGVTQFVREQVDRLVPLINAFRKKR